jgi:glucosamine kinase
MPRIVVGVDAGGSRTIAAVTRGDEAPQTFAGRPANPNVCGVAEALEAIAGAVTGVLRGDRADAIAAGVAGAGRPETASALAAGLRERFPQARVAVTDDAQMALRGAVPAGDGIVLIAGTGSVAYAEACGRSFRAGGGGYALGDDGSGYAVGSSALKLLMRRFEGRAGPDRFLDAVAASIGAASTTDVIDYVYGAPAPVSTVAGIAQLVLDFADAGERSAAKIVQVAALELFELVHCVCRLAQAQCSELPLVFSGGLLQRNGLLTYLIETRVGNELPYLRIVKGGGAPHVGALAEARRLLRSGSP